MPEAKGFAFAPGQPPREAEEEITIAEAPTPAPLPKPIPPQDILSRIQELQARLDLVEKTLQDIQAQLAKTKA